MPEAFEAPATSTNGAFDPIHLFASCWASCFFGTGMFLLLEVSARVYLFGFAGLDSHAQINSIRGLPQTGFTRPAPAGQRPRLRIEAEPRRLFQVRAISHQFTGLERPGVRHSRKPEGTFRVAVLGASFALPSGVAIEDAFHSLLEERLSEEFAPTRYEFINFAVGMYNPGQVLACARAAGPRLRSRT